jgi:hypothetical protein
LQLLVLAPEVCYIEILVHIVDAHCISHFLEVTIRGILLSGFLKEEIYILLDQIL